MTDQTVSPNAIKALAHFTSSDQNRPALAKIHIEQGVATSANRFILATAKTNTNGFIGNVDPAQLLNVAKTVKNCNTLYLNNNRDDGSDPRVIGMGTYSNSANWGPLTVTNETFPDRLSVIPVAQDNDCVIQISPKILEQLVRASKAVGGNAVHLRIQENPDTKPIRFLITGGTDKIAGVLMPLMPDTDKSFAPDWDER
jgi:hypothetical protein